MYGVYPYIYHKNQPNVGKYTIHGSYGKGQHASSIVDISVSAFLQLDQVTWKRREPQLLLQQLLPRFVPKEQKVE